MILEEKQEFSYETHFKLWLWIVIKNQMSSLKSFKIL